MDKIWQKEIIEEQPSQNLVSDFSIIWQAKEALINFQISSFQ